MNGGEPDFMIGTMRKLLDGEKALIVCIGDSITEQNRHLHGHLNYVGMLDEKLTGKYPHRVFVFNTGISGNTAGDVAERLERDALRFKPDLVVVMLGMNDSTRGMDGLPAFQRNLEAIASRIAASGSEVLLMTQNPLNFDLPDNVRMRGSYPLYVDAIREIAASREIPLCDVHLAWEAHLSEFPHDRWVWMNDEIHPNEHGHRFMARVLLDYLSHA